ncbi:MAG: oxidoreductase [Chitinophaga sp.]|jgi:hypothetical protein|nr:oxidoreductase [Chitinophaga sp.]
MKKILVAFSIMLSVVSIQSQTIQVLTEGTKTSIRGLNVVNDNIFWASGSSGKVAKSTDGGKTIQWQQVKGYEKRDFRDIEAFDSNTAIIMGVDWPAIILKTNDGGKNWYKVFEDSTKGMFLDAMVFDKVNPYLNINDTANIEVFGIVIGDPINGKPFFAVTTNAGSTWKKPIEDKKVKFLSLNEGEAFFASSGTNIKITDYNDFSPPFAVTGGKQSRLIDFLYHKDYGKLPIIQGKESTGANSIDVNNKTKKGVVVGGDFANDKDTTLNCVLINFNSIKPQFTHPQTPPHGYRSCVIYLTDKKLITCGTSGIDISNDGGKNWQLISNESFHVVQKAKNGSAVFLAGGKGRIAKVIF